MITGYLSTDAFGWVTTTGIVAYDTAGDLNGRGDYDPIQYYRSSSRDVVLFQNKLFLALADNAAQQPSLTQRTAYWSQLFSVDSIPVPPPQPAQLATVSVWFGTTDVPPSSPANTHSPTLYIGPSNTFYIWRPATNTSPAVWLALISF
jgi:hypothetical protein